MKYSGGINPDCVRPVMDSRDAEERSAARGSSEKPGEAGRQAGRQAGRSRIPCPERAGREGGGRTGGCVRRARVKRNGGSLNP